MSDSIPIKPGEPGFWGQFKKPAAPAPPETPAPSEPK